MWNAWRVQRRDIRLDLVRVTLHRANLSRANLSRADLDGINLDGATLTGANLTGANLFHVLLVETVFGNTNLSAVQGLETCYYRGPNILDHRMKIP